MQGERNLGKMAGRGFLFRLVEPAYARVAVWYQGVVSHELTKFGLRYDDLLDPLQDTETEAALERLPQREVDLRNQRLKRALDHSMKHTELSPELKAQQTPYDFYLEPMRQEIKAENFERAELETDKPYHRTLP